MYIRGLIIISQLGGMLFIQSEKLLNSMKLIVITGFVYNKVIMCNSFDYTVAYIIVFLHVLCKKVVM